MTWVAKNEVDLPVADAVQVMGLLERLEELDDVQSVSSSLNVTEEIAAAMS